MSGHLHFIITEDNGKTYNIPFPKKRFKIASILTCIFLGVVCITALTSFGLWATNRHMTDKLSSLQSKLAFTQRQIAETEKLRKEQEQQLNMQVTSLERDNVKLNADFKEEKDQLLFSAITKLQKRSELIESVMGTIGIEFDSIDISNSNNGGPFVAYPTDLQDDLILQADQYLQLIRTLPVGRPVKGAISSRYGKRSDPLNRDSAFHTGVDLRGKYGENIYATGDGVIEKACQNGDYGNYVLVNHGNGYKTAYAHMKQFKVRAGQKIQRGQVIGLVGNTGRSTGAHLHYEILLDNKTINPRKFLTAKVPKIKPPKLTAQRKIKQ